MQQSANQSVSSQPVSSQSYLCFNCSFCCFFIFFPGGSSRTEKRSIRQVRKVTRPGGAREFVEPGISGGSNFKREVRFYHFVKKKKTNMEKLFKASLRETFLHILQSYFTKKNCQFISASLLFKFAKLKLRKSYIKTIFDAGQITRSLLCI